MLESQKRTHELTRLLQDAASGDRGAYDRLLPLVYEELRRAARRQLARERAGHTLQTTALVHEAYLRLAAGAPPDWKDRSHFLGIAARVMRRVLVDHGRRRAAVKRGGDPIRTELGEVAEEGPAIPIEELLALEEAIEQLRAVEERLARVVELRFFLGMSEEEIAHVLGVSARTVERDWSKARALLHSRIYGDEDP
ncbi:MAG: sigma-70 family RNA polymerase sigma factor [Candidatus Eisenbacteria bacterium]|nr:sigma-70 family RNA polymerase sigma factor [Candidatus Eisenbacteria bacterium]